MEKIDIKQQILPIYLSIVLLLQIKPYVLNILLVLMPLIIISISIYMKNKKIGMVGIFLFYTVSISQLLISNVEDFLFVFLETFILIIPSVILLSQILQLENKEIVLVPLDKKKPMLIASSLVIIITLLFYLIAIISWEGFLLSTESVEGQILLLAAITVPICTSLLIK